MIKFQRAPIRNANQLASLASKLNLSDGGGFFGDIVIPKIPPRNVTTILDLMNSGRDREISTLEWMTLLNGKEQWDIENRDKEVATNNNIWETSVNNEILRTLLFWRFVLFLGDNNINFPSGLSHRFKQFETKLLGVAEHKTLVTKGLVAEDYSHLCKLMLKLKTDLSNVMKQCGLPFSKQNNHPVIRSLPSYWFSNKSNFDPLNLLDIAHRLDQDDKNCLYSSVLEDIPTDKLAEIPLLVEVLKSGYSPYAENSQHHKLSDVAKSKLLELIGAMSFNDFKKLVDVLTSEPGKSKLGLEDWEVNQLSKRISFWSNYQPKIVSFKAFVPDATYRVFEALNINLSELSITKLSPGAKCEVCALEFSEYFVVELLRGANSGVRVFEKDTILPLLSPSNNEQVNLELLESLPYLAEHDHLFLWQNSCEEMLRTKYNIAPDKTLKVFLIDTKTASGKPFTKKYTQSIGLPPLSKNQVSEREGALLRNSHRRRN